MGSAGARISAITADTTWSGLPPGVPLRNSTLDATPGRSPLDPLPATPGPAIATIEHLMAALAGLGIWEALITLDGPEVPILDGSAHAFVEALRPALRAAPPRPSPSHPEPIVLTRQIEVRRGDARIVGTPPPADRPCTFTYEVDYGPGSPIPAQHASWSGSAADFALNIAPARTFSLAAEAKAARAVGLFRHLSPRDMVVVGDDGNPIDNAWRLPSEPARHKLLDLIGDLALLGRPLAATVVASRSGHALTHEFCREILRQGV